MRWNNIIKESSDMDATITEIFNTDFYKYIILETSKRKIKVKYDDINNEYKDDLYVGQQGVIHWITDPVESHYTFLPEQLDETVNPSGHASANLTDIKTQAIKSGHTNSKPLRSKKNLVNRGGIKKVKKPTAGKVEN